jgi:hypothetical protein
MTRYLTRQVAVEAIQWDGKEDTFGAIRDMLGDEYNLEILDEVEGILQLDTSTGAAWPMKTGEAGEGDWVVWDGQYAHCYKHEQFWEFFRQAIPEIIEFSSQEQVQAWLDERNERIAQERKEQV